ncbi:MAG: hypothetical protein BWY97_00707 [Tenericutes bacterium ADurb.BinA124]|nr:MAG: hypothetical protein BWY97_00707 [Tenericutes bacterium ADurb.BinA124]
MIIIDYVNFSLYLIISLSGIFLIFYMRVIELAKINRVKNIYFQKCYPQKFLTEHDELMNGFILSQKQIHKNQLFKITVYLNLGNVNQAKQILDALTVKTAQLSIAELYWLLIGWFNYFEEIDDLEKMEIFFEKIKMLNNELPQTFKQKTLNNYLKIQARYFIKSGIYLDNAETVFIDSLKNRKYFINVIDALYYLGIVAFKQNKKELALERLNFVVQSQLKELSIYHKSLDLVELISNEPTI